MTVSSADVLHIQVFPSIIGFFVMLSISAIALVRGWNNRVNLLFSAVVFLGALLNLDLALISIVQDKSLALTIDRAAYLFLIFSPPVYIQFVHSFLGLKKRKALEYTFYTFSLVLLMFVPGDHFIPALRDYQYGTIARAGPAYHVFSLLIAFAVLYSLKTLYDGMNKAADNLQKTRIKYILVGMGFSALFISLNILPVSGMNVYPLSNFSFIPAAVLGYGFLKYDLLDLGAVLRKSAAYLLLTGVLTGMYVLAILGLNLFFLEMLQMREIAVSFIFALIVVLFFKPVKDITQRLIDRLFFAGKYDYQVLLREVSERMTLLPNADDIGRLLLDFLMTTFQVRRVDWFLKKGDGIFYHGTLEEEGRPKDCGEVAVAASVLSFLAREKIPVSRFQLGTRKMAELERRELTGFLDRTEAVLAAPVMFRGEINGFFCLGQKKSGDLFVPGDLSLLTTLANQAAMAVENALNYQKLETFNRELEKNISDRTADLLAALAAKEKAQRRLIRVESMAGIGRLAAGVAHELNNPLAAGMSLVQTSIQTIGQGDFRENDRADVIDDLRFVLKELNRAADIVRSLLGVSRQRENYLEPVDINRVLDDSLRILHNQYKHLEVEINKEFDGDVPLIEGNFAELSQVMINLVKNAIQSLPAGKGIVTLKTGRRGNDQILVEITDTGRGMTGEELASIFNPFYTTKPVGEGVGLGLYISHSIVERHGGDINCDSSIGRGSVFTVALPIKRS